jgi:hypothetical protein
MYLSKVEVFSLDNEVLIFFYFSSTFGKMTKYLKSAVKAEKSLTLTKDKTKKKKRRMKLTLG